MSEENKLSEEKKQDALDYHSEGRPGKIEVIPTKPCATARDLSLAYSPGVAFPCLEIAKDENQAFKYTAKGNLVGVISNGSAVLGLGNIGAQASKPVMEGKGILFKRFADIDVYDIEINQSEVDDVVKTVKALAPTFGGINLEDFKAPECFEIERRCIEELDIPVFHDDQHGTAIICSAAFLNALEITKRKIHKAKIVFSGAGAAAIACAKLFLHLGVKKENLIMCDSKGVIYRGRKEGMNPYKEEIAIETELKTLAEAMEGADAFMGCSAKGILTQEMVKTMAKRPIIFAMANPDPEILPEEVAQVRDDAIMATGRSDYPNQVNNVLGFPFIFRGALDVKAKEINIDMKMAAVYALADLAKEEVPDEVKSAYSGEEFSFGKNYLIPKPFDKRVLTRVAPAVAKAAMESNVARVDIDDLNLYAQGLEARLGNGASFMRSLRDRLNSKTKPKIVFTEGTNARVLKAVSILLQEDKIDPILLGRKDQVLSKIEELGLSHLKSLPIVHPSRDENFGLFTKEFFEERKRKGTSYSYAKDLMKSGNYFASMMVKKGLADGLITGATQGYPNCFRPIMRVLGEQKAKKAAGIIILIFKTRVVFLADCTSQITPNEDDLSEIALETVKLYNRLMHKNPQVAFLSFSNFGSNHHPEAKKMARAAAITKEKNPQLDCDGEMQGDVAVNDTLLNKLFSFSNLKGPADILIFPDLNSANICYKLLAQLGEATTIGPILVPMDHAVNIVQRTSTVSQIVNMSTLTGLIAQENRKNS